MGYMEITLVGSDMAAGLASVAIDKMVAELKKGVKVEENEYNTDGFINVACFFEELIVPNAEAWASICSEKLLEVAKDALKRLDISLEKKFKPDFWEDEANRLDHQKRYRELRASLQKFIKAAEDA
jgi:hypothetical protein